MIATSNIKTNHSLEENIYSIYYKQSVAIPNIKKKNFKDEQEMIRQLNKYEERLGIKLIEK